MQCNKDISKIQNHFPVIVKPSCMRLRVNVRVYLAKFRNNAITFSWMLRCKKALEKRIEKRHEVEINLKEKSESHKMNIRKELRDIAPLRETMEKELEHVGLVLKKLDAQTKEINLYRERRVHRAK
ncbi:hypothetical protein MTR67_010359 [Solanum verrucosum]|uniref:Uncharacterized protein n=1 Tax=Solanum verrucosum TaxID=315347 RepID=A0AAF0TFN2_SOLVR|nr:hypothetical protein MTR67_010359 [Solanum verrucosum]